MKRFILNVSALAAAALVLFSCAGKKAELPEIQLVTDENGLYQGLDDVDRTVTPELAGENGAFVVDSYDDKNYTLYGGENFSAFLDRVNEIRAGNADGDAGLRYMLYIDGKCYVSDLIYSDGYYYYYASDERADTPPKKFRLLRALTFMEGIPKREMTYFVLTDSLELTGADVRNAFISSSTENITDIPFYWLPFGVYLDDDTCRTAAEKLNVEVGDIVSGLVKEIADDPELQMLSDPWSYINAHHESFDALTALGAPAADYMTEYLRASKTYGLDCYVMAAACAQITGIASDGWNSADEWFALYDEVNAK